MRRIFFAVALLLTWVAAAWGANPVISLEAVYTDDNSAVNITSITPYREVAFRYSIIADTPSISYSAFVMGNAGENNAHNIHEEGTVSTTTSPIPYNLKVTFVSEEEGYVHLYVFDGNGAGGSSENNFKAVKGTPPTVNVTGVKIGEDSIFSTPVASMEIALDIDWDKSKTLKATVEPENATNKKVTWASDKETVATVSNGRIEAKGPGEATITATTEDGGFKATCKVKVTRDGATSITLDQSTMFMTVGDTRLIWVSPNTLLRDYQKTKAELSNTNIVSVEKDDYSETVFKVTAIKAGETILTISTEGANGDTIKASCDITVTAAVTPTTPATPSTPNTPDTPATPDIPVTPNNPATPDIPATPDAPNTPATPSTPATPDTPTTPNTPNTPAPLTPATPQTPDSTDSGGGGGCNAGFLGLAALAALAMKKR